VERQLMTVYIVDIEAVDTRYTKQWKEHLPRQMRQAGMDVIVITGGEVPQATTPGAFLNFAGTNNYKSQQMLEISRMFAMGDIKDGDYFLYTDAWNPTVIQLRYMAELLGIKIKIGGLWHAGSYDPNDFLGRLIGDAPWVRSAEHSMFNCYDHNFFATRFHVNMFAENLLELEPLFEDDAADLLIGSNSTVRIVAWPMEYLRDVLAPYANTPKKQKIIFPHRLAPEKQVEIFRDLAREMPEYEWFVAQDHSLTKHEYHTHLAESKIVFSANLQETLGISMYEGALVGAYPLVPDRLSYREMWEAANAYPSEWTEDWDSYQKHKPEMISLIRHLMGTNSPIEDRVRTNIKRAEGFFDGQRLYADVISTQIR
jgi:hypothetical protein